MIRDEYNKKKQTVKFNAKEERKKKEMGERNYYASQIPKINDMCKALSTSFLITLIFLGLAYAVILLSFIVLRNTETPTAPLNLSFTRRFSPRSSFFLSFGMRRLSPRN